MVITAKPLERLSIMKRGLWICKRPTWLTTRFGANHIRLKQRIRCKHYDRQIGMISSREWKTIINCLNNISSDFIFYSFFSYDDDVSVLIQNNNIWFYSFLRNYWKDSPFATECPIECKREILCQARSGRSHDKQNLCPDLLDMVERDDRSPEIPHENVPTSSQPSHQLNKIYFTCFSALTIFVTISFWNEKYADLVKYKIIRVPFFNWFVFFVHYEIL